MFSEFNKRKGRKDGLRSQCRVCCSEYHKQHYKANKEKYLERIKQYREVNKEKIVERQKQYNEANKEKIAVQKKQHYEANKEKYVEYRKQYREANKEKITAREKQYREANKERIAVWAKQYRGNMPAAIYEIKNIKNGKVYIGCSTTYPRRWYTHKFNLRKGIHVNKHLQEDYNTFGLEAFEFSVVEEFPSDTPFKFLEAKETQLILEKKLRGTKLYNLSIKINF